MSTEHVIYTHVLDQPESMVQDKPIYETLFVADRGGWTRNPYAAKTFRDGWAAMLAVIEDKYIDKGAERLDLRTDPLSKFVEGSK